MRRRLIAANWKMNTSAVEADELASVARELDRLEGVEIVLCPPFVWLERVRRTIEGSGVRLGAQDVSEHMWGAYTGEVSALQVAELCEFTLVGHSERRRFHAETDAVVAAKLAAAGAAGLTPVLCVGEDAQEHDRGEAESVVQRQLFSALWGGWSRPLVVAYEPLWAIGTGVPARPDQAGAMAASIRRGLGEAGADAERVPILYGGSVSAATLAGFVAQPQVDGALVGGASLRREEFVALVRVAASA